MALELLAVLVPLIIAGITTLRWPTLQRRVRGHVDLLKDLPSGTGDEFRAAVEEELSALADQARRRLHSQVYNIALGIRITMVSLIAILYLALFIRLGIFDPDTPPLLQQGPEVAEAVSSMAEGLLLPGLVLALLALAWFASRGIAEVVARDIARKKRKEAGRKSRGGTALQ
jgi:ABC-type amino acid transport system permease subunit